MNGNAKSMTCTANSTVLNVMLAPFRPRLTNFVDSTMLSSIKRRVSAVRTNHSPMRWKDERQLNFIKIGLGSWIDRLIGRGRPQHPCPPEDSPSSWGREGWAPTGTRWSWGCPWGWGSKISPMLGWSFPGEPWSTHSSHSWLIWFHFFQIRAEIEKRLCEKEEEFENTRKVHQQTIESIQATLDAESKAKVYLRTYPRLLINHIYF